MSTSRTIAITGASGLVGTALAEAFAADGVRVLRLVRHPVSSSAVDEVYWKPSSGEIDAAKLEGVDLVFNLAGKGIANDRWTPAVKKLIIDSRVNSTRLIAKTVAGLENKPRALVSASAIGFYGDRGDETLDEDSPPGEGFLTETCQWWENAGAPAWEAGVRVAQMRLGMVLSPKGGALAKMLPIFKLGAGGVIGSGEQVMSWIALPDLVRALRFVGDVEAMHGAINATSPEPVTNRQFTKTLGQHLGRPTLLPVPEFALKMAMGEMSELLLDSARVLPKRLSEAGFEFETPGLATALERLLK
ncbi:TIGR01777 family oxidoreductase [Botrimarina mediterranea]|uniref:Epimerase family protein n=1 Tax=Botrimarina mediterranea TaxID=2528022 RepID=A0A518K308_9BACT|nr:TIGR01777 family oxidoreductase [Botrimarina mediterranea]QDV72182.1 Epimerase family protein [Botrimarina mediterranea]QDV76725.1 Epimerase family protein [Planctomycetes bacterium K2D]